uniref:Uncharacterized protein n=1 Tax=Triticum urartu TaxID=4572 RepID=A0A8R7QR98_TRIUA
PPPTYLRTPPRSPHPSPTFAAVLPAAGSLPHPRVLPATGAAAHTHAQKPRRSLAMSAAPPPQGSGDLRPYAPHCRPKAPTTFCPVRRAAAVPPVHASMLPTRPPPSPRQDPVHRAVISGVSPPTHVPTRRPR